MHAAKSSRVGWRRAGLVALCLLLAAGCSTVPDQSLELSPESLKLRQLQMRRIEGSEESALLAASASVPQDLGFNID